MHQTTITLVHKEKIAPAWWQYILSAPTIAPQLTPGQFLQLRCADPFLCYLRRPIFPRAVDAQHLSLLVRPDPDPGLAWLLGCPIGTIFDVIGPLGQGFPLASGVRQVGLISDEPRLSPLLGQLQRALDNELNITLVLGASQAKAIYPTAKLPLSVEIQIVTRDGSLGQKGTVREFVPALLTWADVVYAIGSTALLRYLQQQIVETRFSLTTGFLYGLPPQSLYLCGFGACLGCTVRTQTGLKRPCVDGPVFDLADY